MRARIALSTVVVLLLLASSTGCTLDRVVAQQEKATGLWGELVGGEAFGQLFVSQRDNLYRIDLGTATFARSNSAPVTFHLQSGPEANGDTVTVTLPGLDIQNERPTSFVFPPLPDSAGRTYFFYIESPEGKPGDAITVYANAKDLYTDGTAYRNGHAVPGDLAFTTYSRQEFSFSSTRNEFLGRLAQDPSFLLCDSLLVVLVLCGLFWVACARNHPRGF